MKKTCLFVFYRKKQFFFPTLVLTRTCFHLGANFDAVGNFCNIGSQWLNVVPCKNLGLKLDDQQLRISIVCVSVPTPALRIRATGKRVERDGLHGLSCTKSAGRVSRHATLNSHKADVGISRLAINAPTAWTVPN